LKKATVNETVALLAFSFCFLKARAKSAPCVRLENYVIYYRQEGSDALIARVLHGRDQIAAWSPSS